MNQSIELPIRGKSYQNQLETFASHILRINESIDLEVSSRGWCYLLEGDNLITKDQFDRVQKLINKCRKLGYLPIDFVAEEKSRNFENLDYLEKRTPKEVILNHLRYIKRSGYDHSFDFWENEEYYIEMLVEKVDLLTLFKDICAEYHIPIANSVGWSSILQRAEMIKRFKHHEEQGCIPVLLYCGDFDPSGLEISNFLKKNCEDLSLGTSWNPKNLIVDRFGLNYNFIQEHNLTWIDNLISGQGKKPDQSKPLIKEYIAEYGERKVEANAIIRIPDIARKLCEDTIIKYLGDTQQKRADKKREYLDIYNSVRFFANINDPLQKAIELLENFNSKNIENLDSLSRKNEVIE